MTKNQIEYWKSENEKKASERTARIQRAYNEKVTAETERANRARERETNRANTINFALQAKRDEAQKNHWDWSRAETAAHNRRSEELETQRLQQDYEYRQQSLTLEQERQALGYYQAASSLEGAKYAAGASYANVAMMDRANVARQAEINRSNLVNEQLQSEAQHTQLLNTLTNMKDAETRAANAATARQQANLDALKWNTALLPKTQAETELLGQQAATSAAQRDRWTEQSHVERVNAFTNVLGNVGRLIPIGGVK